MISNNYQQQLNYGAIKDRVPQNIGDKLPPSVQNYDVRESVGENTAVKAAKNANMEPVTIAMTGGLWLAFAQICQHLNNKLNANWENSWLGKIGKKFDGISNKLNIGKNQSKFRSFVSNITDKSKILRTLKTPTRPQNSMAITQARGITGYVMSDVSSMT